MFNIITVSLQHNCNTMVLHTNPKLREDYILTIINSFPQFSKNELNKLATDRLLYLNNLVLDCANNTESEIKRIINIKANFNKSNDDRKFNYVSKHSIKTQFVKI